MRKLAGFLSLSVLILSLPGLSAQTATTDNKDDPPPVEKFSTFDVEFGWSWPGVNNVQYCKVTALAVGLTPGQQYYCIVMAQGDQLRDVQAGDFVGKDGPLIANAEGKIVFAKTYTSFADGLPNADFYYSYKLGLFRANGTATDAKGWFQYWLF